jgi:cytochrome c
LHRLRIVDDRVAYDERIEIGQRLRDVISLPDGRLVVFNEPQKIGIIDTNGPNLHYISSKKDSTDKPMTVEKAANANSHGASIFSKYCASCHDMNKIGIGPPLLGIIGHGVGKNPDFKYSADLSNSNLIWTRELLLSYITNPNLRFPSSRMGGVKVREAEADELYRFLETDPFIAPFAIDQKVKVAAYDKLLPGFWIGFDDAKGSTVYVQQRPAAADPAYGYLRYILEFDVVDLAGSDWLAIERELSDRGNFNLSVLLRAKMSKPGNVNIVLYIPQLNGPAKQILLGEATIGLDLQSFEFKRNIRSIDFGDTNEKDPPRVIANLPTENHFSIELAEFKVSVAR